MPDVKIGIQTLSLKQPLRKALVTAARLGAGGVEIDARTELPVGELSRTGLREFHKMLDDMSLRVAALSFPTRRGYDSEDDLERRVAATQGAMRMAADLRAEVVINRVGRVSEDEKDADFSRMVEALTAIGMYGQRNGVRLAALTMGESPKNLARLIAALPEQTLGVDLHPIGLMQGGYSVNEALEFVGPHVIHVHACDAVRDLSTRRAIDVELGRGSADLPAVLGQLTEFDYRGWVTVERRNSSDAAREIGNAVEYLRSL